ncbi:MAG TPA: hypothetical protein EYQ27_12355 [Gemmatimonadetes bacterium]|nr:hypothetical protein [Gemmatimonadota bacterium]
MTDKQDDRHDGSVPPPAGKPTPVRNLGSTGDSTQVQPDTDIVAIEVEGVSWTVRVQGRSGGSSPAKAPLLLLGFWKSAPSDAPPDREALIVGSSLAALNPDELVEVHAQSAGLAERSSRPGFFAEISGRRRS